MKSCIENAIIPVLVTSFHKDFESYEGLAIIKSTNSVHVYQDDVTCDRYTRIGDSDEWRCVRVKDAKFKINVEKSKFL